MQKKARVIRMLQLRVVSKGTEEVEGNEEQPSKMWAFRPIGRLW